MDNILEKLGITPGPWGGGINYVPYYYNYCFIDIPNGTHIDIPRALCNDYNTRMIMKSPDMLNEMITFCLRVDKGEVRSRKTYAAFKTIIENIIGLPWENVKDILNG